MDHFGRRVQTTVVGGGTPNARSSGAPSSSSASAIDLEAECEVCGLGGGDATRLLKLDCGHWLHRGC
eukprot:CAMPEP_0174728012 /NCGR_PEP_ID=MMETSP1094-20130205/50891_1 /TAXON_ID=156173 /ORGANISM="Chrysochromulina brevifilum, Strain UTEX LB 985" /LENGTH=66 /DNA_ID=CAMNT_0015929859 /DNA_START=52 /DNA_END=249 /DNA_ORIENTATION=+